jgi:hypothetical protein
VVVVSLLRRQQEMEMVVGDEGMMMVAELGLFWCGPGLLFCS